MKYTIRLAAPKDEKKIRGLFLEMLRTIYARYGQKREALTQHMTAWLCGEIRRAGFLFREK